MKLLFLITLFLFSCSTAPKKNVILGSMNPQLIRSIIRSHLPKYKECANKHQIVAKQNLTVKFTITAMGTTSNIDVLESDISNDLKKCVNEVTTNMKFPKPKGGGRVDIEQPLYFTKKI